MILPASSIQAAALCPSIPGIDDRDSESAVAMAAMLAITAISLLTQFYSGTNAPSMFAMEKGTTV